MQSILKQFFSRAEPLPNISIMGLDGAGKTTLLYKLKVSNITDIVPTIGLYIETGDIQVLALPSSSSSTSPGEKNKRPLRFTARVADTGGCAKFYPIVRHFMIKEDEVSALVWVVDVSGPSLWLDMSLEELKVLLHGDFASSLPILILANKIDVLPERKIQHETELRSRFDELLQGRKYAIFGTNIAAGYRPESGLAEAFAWLGDALTGSSSSSSPPGTVSEPPSKKQTVEKMLSNMRTPEALSAQLEDWLSRAEKDPIALDEELLELFYALNLPSWDHYIHLRLAYILLLKYGRKEGKDKIFDGFKDYIQKNGKGVHGGKSFHLTMTYFWVQMVHLGIARGDKTVNGNADTSAAREAHSLRQMATEKEVTEVGEVQDPALNKDTGGSGFARFLMANPYLVDGQLWADYYSKEVLMSQQAKEGLVFPDIEKLPDVL